VSYFHVTLLPSTLPVIGMSLSLDLQLPVSYVSVWVKLQVMSLSFPAMLL